MRVNITGPKQRNRFRDTFGRKRPGLCPPLVFLSLSGLLKTDLPSPPRYPQSSLPLNQRDIEVIAAQGRCHALAVSLIEGAGMSRIS